MKLSEMATELGLQLSGDDVEITGVAPLEEAGLGDLSFIRERKWLEKVNHAAFKVSALMLPAELVEVLTVDVPYLVTPAPALYVAKAGLLLGYKTLRPEGVHASAVIDPSAQLGANVVVAAHCVIEEGVVIGAQSVIHAGVVIHAGSLIGKRCIIGSNTVIGFDGFGYEYVEGNYQKIPHFGVVRIEDDVEIGASTTIDRARFGETRIGAGSKVDNMVQIAHNVEIGRNCMIVSQVGIAGSCRIEDGVILAGQAGVVPHVTVGRGARIAAATGVAGDVPAGITWSGYWGQRHRDNLAQINAVRALPAFMKQVKKLIKKWENV